MKKQKRAKHDYTNELELKTLIIRINNKKSGKGTPDKNSRINELVSVFMKLNQKKHIDNIEPKRRSRIRSAIKERVIRDSVNTSASPYEEERFGHIIILMTQHIITKPKFSGYTYHDDFYSDASYKILKYLHNFNHTLISERTGTFVNSFSYISQIIHNSIIYIIKRHKKENEKVRSYVETNYIGSDSSNPEIYDDPAGIHPASNCNITKYFHIDEINEQIIEETINNNIADDYVFVCDMNNELNIETMQNFEQRYSNIKFEGPHDE